jgi:hypothetical protein
MDTKSYQARIRVRQRELAALGADERRTLAERARARSARRWEDEEAREDQERRASRLELVLGDGAPIEEGAA